MSGLGKGVVTASIGLLLKARGFKVTAIKIDPYVSVDAGTMRPAEHGEVFVTRDGGEIDQDLGNYERFLNQDLTKAHNITTGKVFQRVIQKERSFFYQGRDAELIPDVIDEIKEMILEPVRDEDFVLVEVGGTTGDLENMPFLHSARELVREFPVVYIMITYVPFLKSVGELKTKPTQHAVARLREVGIFPDFLVTRSEIPIDAPRIETLAKRCFLDEAAIVDDPDQKEIYAIPLLFEKANFGAKLLNKFGLKERKKISYYQQWQKLTKRLISAKKQVKIGLIGKYVVHGADKHRDVYISVIEALRHAAAHHGIKVVVVPIDSSFVESKGVDVLEKESLDGIVVPQGWGGRGTEGKIMAAQYARENNIPYLGLCFGMQMAVIEFARNVCKLKGANSTEVDPDTKHPVIYLMPEQKKHIQNNQYGGTIRLGDYPCRIKKGSKLFRIYGKSLVRERHRHRYEFNNRYRQLFEKNGMKIVGEYPKRKLAEAIEISDHPFFIATQFHPEYGSRLTKPHPLFKAFLRAALQQPFSA